MANKTSSTGAVSNLGRSQSSEDLIPGNVRAIAAVTDGLGNGHGTLSDVTAGLADTANTLTWTWSGPAAIAFADHCRAVIATADDWNSALDTVLAALDTQGSAVTASQDTAADALASWKQARQLAAQESRLLGPGSEVASNADATRAQLEISIAKAKQRAEALLTQARADLANAGEDAAQIVREATEILRANPLPPLHETVNSATALTAVGASSADGSDQPGPAMALPGWTGATVTVSSPVGGVHDTLWRIAGRELGDPRRWPEIYRLNVGQPVGAHAVLTDPNVLQPGWTLRLPPATPLHAVLMSGVGAHPHTSTPHSIVTGGHVPTPTGPAIPRQPTTAQVPSPAGSAGPAPEHAGTEAPPSSGAVPPPPPVITTPTPDPDQPSPNAAPTAEHSDSGVDLGDGLVVAGGVAAALAGIVVATGFQRRYAVRRAANTTSQPEPVVRRLTADLTASQAPSPVRSANGADPGLPVGVAAPVTPGPGTAIPLGHRDGRAVLADIAATQGLGLTGPGAVDAVRGMLITTLTMRPRATVLMSAYDLRGLSGGNPTAMTDRHTNHDGVPLDDRTAWGRVTVAANLGAVLDRLEAEILTRTRLLEDTTSRVSAPPLMVFTSKPIDTRRLQAVADLGAGLGIAIVVLGRWTAGVTCVVGPDGRVLHAHGECVSSWNLAGLRLFTAGAADTANLLSHLAATPGPRRAPVPATPLPQPTRPVHNLVDKAATAPVAAPQEGSIAHRLAPDDLPDSPTPGDIAERLGGPITQLGALSNSSPRESSDDRPDVLVGASIVDAAPGSAQSDTESTSTSVTDRTVAAGDGPPPSLLVLRALGAVRLSFQDAGEDTARDITSEVGPRLRELLVFIALQPDGVRRDEVVAALWPDTNPRRHTHALNAALARLRRGLGRGTDDTVTELIVHTDQRLRLDPAVVSVDLWQFQDAWNAARNATEPDTRATAYRRMIALYTGPFADDVDTDWITAPRQSLHRAATDAVSSLARLLVDTDPQQTLDLLDSARTWDPYNEHIYRDIMRLQAKLGQPSAITRTLELLTTRLAEISTTPSPETHSLADALQHRTSADTAPLPAGAGRPPAAGKAATAPSRAQG